MVRDIVWKGEKAGTTTRVLSRRYTAESEVLKSVELIGAFSNRPIVTCRHLPWEDNDKMAGIKTKEK